AATALAPTSVPGAATNPAATPPAAVDSPTPVVPSAAQAPESGGLLDSLLENPLVLPGAGALVLLLLGFALWRMRSRNRFPAGETSFLESRLQPDSFFGASGGQRVDTRDAAASSSGGESASSMSYSLSQLDAIGDVDPVAEADVYLAYGRDLQAEEILKEALRLSPERMAVRSKLLEVYAKRRDLASYELLASQMFNLTQGNGAEWAQAQALGQTIDPDNALYAPGGHPDEVRDAHGDVVREPLGASTLPYTAPVAEPGFQPAADATLDGPADTDNHIDLELDPADSGPMPLHETTQAFATDLQSGTGDDTRPNLGSQPSTDGGLDFDLEALDTMSPSAAADTRPGEEPLLDFGDLSTQNDETLLGGSPAAGEPMARKLELAEEFRQIGDIEGARDLLEEVISRSDGALRAKAQGMLDRLS
ncbi:MAG: FimV/HubP family polar landmark protein, partial [Rubrivivax sp.]